MLFHWALSFQHTSLQGHTPITFKPESISVLHIMIELIAYSVTITNQHAYCYCLLSLLAGSVLWMESFWVPKLILCVFIDQLILENLMAKLPSLNLLSQGDRCSHGAFPSVGSPSALTGQAFPKQIFSGLSKQGTALDFICERAQGFTLVS